MVVMRKNRIVAHIAESAAQTHDDGIAIGKPRDVRIAVTALKDYVEDWNLESQIRQHTAQSLNWRKDRLGKFFWFLEQRNCQSVGVAELREFFLYCAEAHPEGRWGNPKCTEAMRPATVHGYYRIIKALFNYLIDEEVIDSNPVKRIKPPAVRTEMKHPVSDDHVEKLLQACRHSNYSHRDTAMVLLLVDTGLRASELCELRMDDWDSQNRSLRVLGKGNKYRTVYLGLNATKALKKYFRHQTHSADSPMFVTQRGAAFTASGLFQVMERLSQKAGIANAGIHALRRTFAVNMLKAGANVFTVQILMGHSDLTMTRRYCRIAEADCEAQHRQFSPADRIRRRL